MKKMKKVLAILLSVVLAASIFCGCAKTEVAQTNAQNETKSEELEKRGKLTKLNESEKIAGELADCEMIFFDDMNSMLLALESGKIKKITGLPGSVAKYVEKVSGKFLAKESKYNVNESFSMGTLKENTEVYNLLNNAISILKKNGIIDQLAKEHIYKLVESGEEPPVVEMPIFEGAKTITIGVTGDFAPIDYVAADGTPAGFNVALLSEIAKIAKVNIKLVQVNSGSRLIALTERTVDAVFCFREYKDNGLGIDSSSDVPDAVSITTEYFNDINEILVLKNETA